MKPREVFLSHASRDGDFANDVVEMLKSRGIKVWFSPHRIVGAQQWHDEIGLALNRCDWFVIILSPNAVRSKWVKRELVFALNSSRYDEKIVPLLLRDCDVAKFSWALPTIQWIDFRRSPTAGYRALLKIWGLRSTRR